ncbi:hypothetical protein ACOMHN_019925 [Nucella lapillus]
MAPLLRPPPPPAPPLPAPVNHNPLPAPVNHNPLPAPVNHPLPPQIHQPLPAPVNHPLPPQIHQPLPAPVNHRPLPAPVNHQPLAPVNFRPLPAPVNHQPLAPVNYRPLPAPVNHRPLPAHVNHNPLPAPVNHNPLPAPVNYRPLPAPVNHQPLAPVNFRPLPAPVNHQPLAPVNYQPIAPVNYQPIAPLNYQPIAPVNYQPIAPVNYQPIAPVNYQPIAPVNYQPIAPVNYQPIAPVNHQPLPAAVNHQPLPAPVLAFDGGAGRLPGHPSTAASRLPGHLSSALTPQLIEDIQKQLDHYFSRSNLLRDIFLRKNVDQGGWVSAEILLKFKKMTELLAGIPTAYRKLLCYRVSRSEFSWTLNAALGCTNLVVSGDRQRWRPTSPPPRADTWQLPQDITVPDQASSVAMETPRTAPSTSLALSYTSARRSCLYSRTPRQRRIAGPLPGMTSKTWQVFQLSPLYKFSTQPQSLKQYGRSLATYIVQEGDKAVAVDNGRSKQCAFSIYEGVRAGEDDPEAVQILVTSKANNGAKGNGGVQVKLTAVLCGMDLESNPCVGVKKHFTYYPILLVKSTVAFTNILKLWLEELKACKTVCLPQEEDEEDTQHIPIMTESSGN